MPPGPRSTHSVSTGRRRRLLLAVLGGLLAVNCTITLFNVALVRIAGSLHSTETTLTWAITGPLLVVGIAAPLLGRLGDLRGHRRLYLGGMSGSLLCAVLSAAAWSAPALIVARLFAGFGDACIMASSWALLFRVYPPGERTKVMGWWSLVGAGGPVIGVAVGGPMVQAVGWRWVFIAQAPLIAAALVGCVRLLPNTPPMPSGRLNVRSAIALAVGVGALLFAINQGSVVGWTSAPVLAAAVCVPISLGAYFLSEQNTDSPLIPPEWLRRRGFMLPAVASFGINFCYMGGFFLTPLFLERALGYGVGVTGLMQVARPLVFAVSAPAAGYLATRTGERATAVAGGAIMVASMLLFATIELGEPGIAIIVALGLSGLAAGMAVPSLAACVANSVPIEQMGTASAGLQVCTQVGVVSGIQVMESVEVARAHTGVVASFHDAYLVAALAALVTTGVAAMVHSTARRREELPVPAAGEAFTVPAAAPEPSLG